MVEIQNRNDGEVTCEGEILEALRQRVAAERAAPSRSDAVGGG